MNILKTILLLFWCQSSVSSCRCRHPKPKNYKTLQAEIQQSDCDGPLILTPYIRDGKIEEAQKLSKVHLKDIEDLESYSGFLTVNETCDSNMFFWFFPTERKDTNDPVIVWLQGGPGMTSLFGLTAEIGPFYIENGTTLKRREHYWSDKRNLLFIDNPVGTGYSYTKDTEECYSHDQDDVRRNLYTTLLQFFKLFPNLQKNELFIFGESYAGKYIPAIAYSIHQNNKNASIKLNLKGLGIGNGYTDPVSMLSFSGLLYNIGIINSHNRNRLQKMEDELVQLIRNEDWENALISFNDSSYKWTYFTDHVNMYNYIQDELPSTRIEYFDRTDVKCMVHASNKPFNFRNMIVYDNLSGDFLKSVKPWVEELLEHYHIMFYNGNLDIMVGSVLTQNFLQTLNWSGAEQFKVANQTRYFIGSELMGWGSRYGHLSEVRVRNAGHNVPEDQPTYSYHIMETFINQTRSNT